MQNVTQRAPESTAPDEQELLRRARGVAATLRSRNLEISRARRVPQNVMDELAAFGLLQLARPARYGGPDVSMDTIFRVGRALATGDASVAWVYCVLNSHDHLVGLYPKSIQDEYWSSEQPFCASSYIPSGKVSPAENGFTLSGKWSFCSGIDFSGWIVVGGITLSPGDHPTPELRLFMLEKSEITLLDDWHVMGLSGTGSKSIAVDDVFVPNERVLRNSDVMAGKTPGGSLHANPLYRLSVWPLFGFSIIAPVTGIARGAFDYMVSEFRSRPGTPEVPFDARKHSTQIHLAEAGALIDAAELLYERGLQETCDRIRAEQELPIELRVRNRRDQAYLTGLCRKALDILMSMSGGRGIREEAVVQQALRDLYAISAHPGGNWDSASASYGSVLLGGAPTEPFN
jgi:3-hydroxy-9,10-secoandrosta-1,3,5(10)-triene-9,17-dione monooxygenase